jgi:sulfur carrier protein
VALTKTVSGKELNMTIILNGKETSFKEEITISELLKQGYVKMQEYVTVQVNEEIIPRADYDTYVLKDKDVVECLYYMGGGN